MGAWPTLCIAPAPAIVKVTERTTRTAPSPFEGPSMGALLHLSSLAVRPLTAAAADVLGLKAGERGVDGIVGFVTERFRDASRRLPDALKRAGDRAWAAVEVALEGESLWRRLDRAEDRALREQIR